MKVLFSKKEIFDLLKKNEDYLSSYFIDSIQFEIARFDDDCDILERLFVQSRYWQALCENQNSSYNLIEKISKKTQDIDIILAIARHSCFDLNLHYIFKSKAIGFSIEFNYYDYRVSGKKFRRIESISSYSKCIVKNEKAPLNIRNYYTLQSALLTIRKVLKNDFC